MKWIIILTIIAGIAFVYLLIEAIKDGIEAEPITGTIRYPDEEEMFYENDISDIDETLKLLSLRNKLDKIEEERRTEIDDINIDYQNYEGK